jgi:alkylation response protein AidB-like acyl-CoA dehydrogenase
VFDFEIGEELELLVQTARSFASHELWPRLRSAEGARAVDADVRQTYARTGLGGLELPEALGGAGLGPLARVLVNEELGAADAGAALALDGLGLASSALLELGGEDAVRTWLGPLLEQEHARVSVVSAPAERLRVGPDSVSGVVAWLPTDRVDLLLVLHADGALLVREGWELTTVRGSGLRAAGACELQLRDVAIVARIDDAATAARALARARLYVASLLLGVLRHAAEYSRQYALERVAFGKPIAHHQALAFLITDMHTAVEGARLLVHDAALRAERGASFEAEAASAFVEVLEASRFVGPNGVQILGGHGFMQDHPMEKAMREARALGLLLGGIDPAREQAGAALTLPEARSPIELCSREPG